MGEIEKKFIDLGFEANQSDYGPELAAKQVKFQKQFEKLHTKIFEDQSQSTLIMPTAVQTEIEPLLEEQDPMMGAEFEGLGQQLDLIHKVMNKSYKHHLIQEKEKVIETF